MREWRLGGRWVAIGVLLLAASGCARPAGVAPGVRFGLRSDDRLLGPTNAEIALVPDATATVEVFEPRELRGGSDVVRVADVDLVTVESATSLDEEVIRVTATRGSQLVVSSGRVGTARVRIVTARWTHELPFVVAEPAHVDLGYVTPDLARVEGPLRMLAGGTARIRIRRTDSMDRVLGGTQHTPPVFVEPRGAATLRMRDDDRDIADVHFGQLAHAILRAPGGRPLEAQIVPEAEVSSFDVVAVDGAGRVGALSSVRFGTRQLVVMRATNAAGERVFGLGTAAGLTSAAADVCLVEDVSRWYADGVFVIDPRAPGACRVTAALGARSIELTITID